MLLRCSGHAETADIRECAGRHDLISLFIVYGYGAGTVLDIEPIIVRVKRHRRRITTSVRKRSRRIHDVSRLVENRNDRRTTGNHLCT